MRSMCRLHRRLPQDGEMMDTYSSTTLSCMDAPCCIRYCLVLQSPSQYGVKSIATGGVFLLVGK